jgi:hypothetical protein
MKKTNSRYTHIYYHVALLKTKCPLHSFIRSFDYELREKMLRNRPKIEAHSIVWNRNHNTIQYEGCKYYTLYCAI